MSLFLVISVLVALGGDAPASPAHRDPLDHVPAPMRNPRHVQFCPASDAPTEGWTPMGVDGRVYHVAGAPVFEGTHLASAAATDAGILELGLEPRAAERLVRFPVDQLAIVVHKQLLAVCAASPVGEDGVLRLTDFSEAEYGRVEVVLSLPPLDDGRPRVMVVPQRSAIAPGERLRVDMYVSAVNGLRMYEIGLDPVGGRKGRLIVEDVRIERDRPDFVFAGKASISGTQPALAIIGGALGQGLTDVDGRAYLGTYMLRSSPDAEGTFTLKVRGDAQSRLYGEWDRPIDARLGASAIRVGVDANPGFAK